MVKIFSNGSMQNLEQSINAWLEENNDRIEVKSISYATETRNSYFSALVYYVTSRAEMARKALKDFHERD